MTTHTHTLKGPAMELRVTNMPNGLSRIVDLRSGLTCCVISATGRHHSGDLRIGREAARRMIGRAAHQ